MNKMLLFLSIFLIKIAFGNTPIDIKANDSKDLGSVALRNHN